MSFQERWNSVRSACFARLWLAGSNPASFLLNTTLTHVPQRFEHYELMSDEDGKPVELGRGAMGVTYKAFDVDLRCPVTLKVINDKYLGDEVGSASFFARSPCSGQRPSLERCLGLPPWQNCEAVTSTRWSLWKEKRLRISSNAQAGLR